MISSTRAHRSGGHPAAVAKTQARWPPACSKGTVWLSNAVVNPMSCSIADTKYTSSSNTTPCVCAYDTPHKEERMQWLSNAGEQKRVATSTAARVVGVTGSLIDT